MAEEPLHFKIRLPPEMHAKLKDFAARNRRTMSAEILARVAQTIEAEELRAAPSTLQRVHSRLLDGVEFLDEDSDIEPPSPHSAEAEHWRDFVLQILREEGLLSEATAPIKKGRAATKNKK